MSEPLVLRTVIGAYDHVRPLRDGRVASDRVRLELIPVDPLPKAFRQMVRSQEYDVCEMALTTQALAHRYGKPIVALPIPLWGRLSHANLVCAAGSAIRGPRDLAGQRVGVRAYSQTTGVWVRGILRSQYGVDLSGVTWVTMEDAHVAEYQDPPNAVRNASGMGLRELLLAGELAAIMGERNVDPQNVRSVIPEAEAAGEAWSRETGIVPVNHVLSVRADLLHAHPWLKGELMALFEEARRVSGADGPAYGLEPNRRPMQMLLDFCAEQGLTERAYPVDEIFPA